MKTGKFPNDMLNRVILECIKKKRKEVILGPGIGEDCCVLDIGNNLCVVSTDPITGANEEIGSLLVNVSCNDIASCGAEPIGILVTILAPVSACESDVRTIMDDIISEADKLNVELIGGHTEVTDSVNRYVLSGTCIGKVHPDKLVTSRGAKPGDDVVMTGTAGIEGTAVISHDHQNDLENTLGKELVLSAKSFSGRTSVVKVGIIAGKAGVHAMHDATEGGILGAVWELCEASGTGVVIHKKNIPVALETEIICRLYDINPLKLISSGSMLITCKDGEKLVSIFKKEGIVASVIGKLTQEKGRYMVDGENKEAIQPPGSDELYKLIESQY